MDFKGFTEVSKSNNMRRSKCFLKSIKRRLLGITKYPCSNLSRTLGLRLGRITMTLKIVIKGFRQLGIILDKSPVKPGVPRNVLDSTMFWPRRNSKSFLRISRNTILRDNMP
jgi:hypothetical protein